MTQHCLSIADVKSFADADISNGRNVLEPIAAGIKFRERMLEILQIEYEGSHGWMVGLMIQLAGRMQCEESGPLLLSKFAVDWDWYNEQILHAFQAIGTPAAHQRCRILSRPTLVRTQLSAMEFWSIFIARELPRIFTR